MPDWRSLYHPQETDEDGGPPSTIWSPSAAGHFIDPRVRIRILENPNKTIIMVHRAGMASANPCWLLLKGETAQIVSSFKVNGTVEAIQMAPHRLGTTACAWLETDGEVEVINDTRDGVVYEDFYPKED